MDGLIVRVLLFERGGGWERKVEVFVREAGALFWHHGVVTRIPLASFIGMGGPCEESRYGVLGAVSGFSHVSQKQNASLK